MIDAYRCIITKRDTRAYADKPIPAETLHRILQAGRMAGSAKNTQPWRFVLLEERAKKEELAACGQFAAHIPSAPVLVAIVMPSESRDFDAGRSAQNMMLAAWAEGITSCPVAMHDQECARRVLGVPEGHRVSIVIAFAYPPAVPRAPGVPRVALDDLLHHGGW